MTNYLLFKGQRLATDFVCPFIEVSASEDVSQVNEAFYALSREVVEFKKRTRTFLNRVFGAFGREKASWRDWKLKLLNVWLFKARYQIYSVS